MNKKPAMYLLGYRTTVLKTNANFKRKKNYFSFSVSEFIKLKSKGYPNP